MSLPEKSEQYLDQLAQMCKTVTTSPIVRQRSYGIMNGAQKLLEQIRNYQGLRNDFRLTLDPNWKIELDDPEICGVPGSTELQFGGEILFKDKCLERQALAVVILFRSNDDHDAINGRPNLAAGEYHVVRRFHFDFDRSIADSNRPLAHLQVGGQLNQDYLDIPDDTQCRYEIFDQLDCPRLPWAIAGLPMVLDTFLRQFPNRLGEFLEGTGWRRHVMNSERLWLMEFFSQVSKTLGNKNDLKCLYDCCCAESTFNQ